MGNGSVKTTKTNQNNNNKENKNKIIVRDELYVAIVSGRDEDVILFYEQGGVDIGDVDAKVR